MSAEHTEKKCNCDACKNKKDLEDCLKAFYSAVESVTNGSVTVESVIFSTQNTVVIAKPETK